MKPDIGVAKLIRRIGARLRAEHAGDLKPKAALEKADHPAGCAGKETFRSWSVAQAVRGRRHNLTMTDAYRCPDCQGWHLGSRLGRAPQAAR